MLRPGMRVVLYSLDKCYRYQFLVFVVVILGSPINNNKRVKTNLQEKYNHIANFNIVPIKKQLKILFNQQFYVLFNITCFFLGVNLLLS